MNNLQRAAQVAQALADPLRLAVLQRLLDEPAAVTDLVAMTGESQPKVSNHLAILRDLGLVRVERQGRQMIYRIAGPAVAHLIESLAALAGPGPRRPQPLTPIAVARTCYDHLAGTLGVGLFDALVAAGAIAPPAASRSDVVVLPEAAAEMLARLGVEAPSVRRGRRFAFACLDWTERRFHLGGALGAAIRDHFFAAGWISRDPASRAVLITPAGRQTIRETLGLDLPMPEPASRLPARTSTSP